MLFFLRHLDGALGNLNDWPGVIPCLVLTATAALAQLLVRSLVRTQYLVGALVGVAVLTLRVFFVAPTPGATILTSLLAPVIAAMVGRAWPKPWWRNSRVASAGILAVGVGTVGVGWALIPSPASSPTRSLFDGDLESYSLRFDSLNSVSRYDVFDLNEGPGHPQHHSGANAGVECGTVRKFV